MKNTIYLLFLLIVSCNSVPKNITSASQEEKEKTPVTAESNTPQPPKKADGIIFSLRGEAALLAQNATEAADLKSSGYDVFLTDKIMLEENASVGILTKGGYTFLEGPGTFGLDFISRSSAMEESEFAKYLEDQVDTALDPYFTNGRAGLTEGPSTTSSPGSPGSIPPPKPSRPGTGNGSGTLVPLAPLGGRVAGGSLTFEWKAVADEALPGSVMLTIKNFSGAEVFQREVTGSSITLPVSEIGLKAGKKYTWMAAAPSGAKVTTGSTTIEYEDGKMVADLRKDLYADPTYQKADPGAKALLEAAALQDLNYLEAARKTLREASNKYPENLLVQWVYDSFAYFNDLK